MLHFIHSICKKYILEYLFKYRLGFLFNKYRLETPFKYPFKHLFKHLFKYLFKYPFKYSLTYLLKYLLIVENICFIIIFSLILHHVIVPERQQDSIAQQTEYFTSVQVRPGESLWEISLRYYSSEYSSMRSYMKRIMQLNHMIDKNLQAGACLVIPYYRTVSNEL